MLAGTLQRQVSTCELVLNALDGPRDFAQDARFNEYDHLSLLRFFEGDRLQAIRASGDRREYFAAIRSAMQKWSQHDDVVAGGESWNEFGARIRAGVAAACAGLGRDDNVLIVTSGGVIGRYTSEVLEAGADAAIQLNLQTRNTSVTEVIRPASSNARLVSFNAIPHLERADRATRSRTPRKAAEGGGHGRSRVRERSLVTSALPHQRHEVARVDRLRGLLDL